MNDNKQIEEMARDISNGICGVLSCEIQKLAEHLISLNYVKLLEDSVVLTREEKEDYESLIKLLTYDKPIKERVYEVINDIKEKAHKETIKEILLDLKPLLEGFVHTDTGENLYIYKCKQFGIEIEE